jgi:hypothetical protein
MKAMKVKKTLQITLGALHLLLVGFSATYCYLDEKISGSRLVDFYGKLSGADSSYGFFAPSIGSRVRGTFDLIAADGSTTATISLEHEQGREADIRMGGVFDEFTSQSGLDENFAKPSPPLLQHGCSANTPRQRRLFFISKNTAPCLCRNIVKARVLAGRKSTGPVLPAMKPPQIR